MMMSVNRRPFAGWSLRSNGWAHARRAKVYPAGMYVIVWQFVAKPGREAEFEAAYGRRGRWAEFFRTGEGYHATELWRGDGSWITVDRWQSSEHYQRFRSEHLAEYEAIDREMESLTAKETSLGAFTAV